MNQERYERLNALAEAKAKVAGFQDIRKESRRDLWIAASVRLSDEQGDELIARFEADIVANAVYNLDRKPFDLNDVG